MRALVEAQDLCARLAAEEATSRTQLESATHRVAELEGSIAFRLGSLFLALRSPRGWLGFPRGLAGLVGSWRGRGRVGAAGPPSGNAGGMDPLHVPGSGLVRAWHMARRPAVPANLSELRIAAVMDEFTEACFAPDCQLLNLSVSGVERQLDDFRPHLLLVESAWRGRDGGWMHLLCPCSGDLRRLVDACRRRGIPTVFWSKEDPGHFENFIEAAGLFDHVFTTDADCVAFYRDRLGHDRVGVLGFACQPKMHNPIELGERAEAASFAGSWYAKYPERARDFEQLVDAVREVLPVAIHDRNHARNDPAFEFPAKYRPLLRSGVPYNRIAEVYKGSAFAITVNTITGSPTMFARRIFELLACNTIAISNGSVGVDRVFGDLVVMAGRDDIGQRVRQLRDSEDARHRLRLRGLREVLGRHTSQARLVQVAAAVVGPVRLEAPRAVVLARVNSVDALERVLQMFSAQQWERKELLLLVPGSLGGQVPRDPGVRVVQDDFPVMETVHGAGWLAPWHPDDYYGPGYLADMMLATSFADVPAIGKSTFFRMVEGAPRLEKGDRPYSASGALNVRSSLFRADALGGRSCGDVADEVAGGNRMQGLVVDEFGYCMAGSGQPGVSAVDVA